MTQRTITLTANWKLEGHTGWSKDSSFDFVAYLKKVQHRQICPRPIQAFASSTQSPRFLPKITLSGFRFRGSRSTALAYAVLGEMEQARRILEIVLGLSGRESSIHTTWGSSIRDSVRKTKPSSGLRGRIKGDRRSCCSLRLIRGWIRCATARAM